MNSVETRLQAQIDWAFDSMTSDVVVKSSDLTALLSEVERLRGERDDARQGERNASEHVRRVAADANEAFAAAEALDEFWDACGHPGNRGTLTPAEQAASLIRECDAAAALADQHRARAERLAGMLVETARLAAETKSLLPVDGDARTKEARAILLAIETETRAVAHEAQQILTQEGEG